MSDFRKKERTCGTAARSWRNPVLSRNWPHIRDSEVAMSIELVWLKTWIDVVDTGSFALAAKAVNRLIAREVNEKITHLIVASCTGFSAPGIDFEIVRRFNLEHSIERTLIGFMGCNAAINALKLARHIVRSETDSRVLIVSVELCTLHLQESDRIEQLLSFLLFGDGCAAAIVSADPHGFSLDSFHAELAQDASDQITWNIGHSGFDMRLSGQVPTTIAHALGAGSERILAGQAIREFQMWAVHPGGRSVLDAVEDAFELDEAALTASRNVLQDYGNMSSPTILFVLDALMREKPAKGSQGCAMAFGPGLTAECMLFSAAA